MDKDNIIDKYGLVHENGAWYSCKENSHKHLIFKDSFLEKADIIGLLFRINRLCMAKVKYFRQNIDRFEPCKYHYEQGFIDCPLWDADFLRHKASGSVIDLRYLQTITDHNDFLGFCEKLETFDAGG